MAQGKQDLGFIKGRFRGAYIAIKGAFLFVTTEPSGMVQFALAIGITIAGFYYDLSATEWMFHALVVGLVLAIEALNTAVEKLCDFVHKDFHDRIGFIKDIAAGGVWFAAMAAFTVELFIFLPKIFR